MTHTTACWHACLHAHRQPREADVPDFAAMCAAPEDTQSGVAWWHIHTASHDTFLSASVVQHAPIAFTHCWGSSPWLLPMFVCVCNKPSCCQYSCKTASVSVHCMCMPCRSVQQGRDRAVVKSQCCTVCAGTLYTYLAYRCIPRGLC